MFFIICDNCKINNVDLIYTKSINGKEIEYNLCSVCAEKIDEKLLFLEIFKDFFGKLETEYLFNNKRNIKCDKCGNTLEDIKNTGKMGCENCYTLFKENILPIIKNIQFDNQHIGKATKATETTIKLKNKLEILKHRLKDAISREDYETAITLRDEIKEIEKGV